MLDQAFTKKVLEIVSNLVASGFSVSTVEEKKYRVRKKLRISSEEDINIWMTRL